MREPWFASLREWAQDDLHLTQSVRHYAPTYPNQAALRADVRRLLALTETYEAALQNIIALPVPRAVRAIEIADVALEAENGHGKASAPVETSAPAGAENSHSVPQDRGN